MAVTYITPQEQADAIERVYWNLCHTVEAARDGLARDRKEARAIYFAQCSCTATEWCGDADHLEFE